MSHSGPTVVGYGLNKDGVWVKMYTDEYNIQ